MSKEPLFYLGIAAVALLCISAGFVANAFVENYLHPAPKPAPEYPTTITPSYNLTGPAAGVWAISFCKAGVAAPGQKFWDCPIVLNPPPTLPANTSLVLASINVSGASVTSVSGVPVTFGSNNSSLAICDVVIAVPGGDVLALYPAFTIYSYLEATPVGSPAPG